MSRVQVSFLASLEALKPSNIKGFGAFYYSWKDRDITTLEPMPQTVAKIALR
ncbi:hypothetical protein [Laspinema olomoucense]|uniref:hypothetical protein n=1 Tax=Laspinema olomoucense TaxID=3231600 RepID=UPI0021BB2C82|nr:hypothetical protein [Laspinema sp. D3b]